MNQLVSWLTEQQAAELFRRYTGSRPIGQLGKGKDGYVFLEPGGLAVGKVFPRPESFRQELAVYRKLRQLGITRVCGLKIPRLLSASAAYRIIRLSVVTPPRLLDFASARFNPPDFSDDVTEQWLADVAELYDQHPSIPWLVYHALRKHGIYYIDIRPANLDPTGLDSK